MKKVKIYTRTWILVALILIIAGFLSTSAQKFSIGGGVNFSLGSDISTIGIAPEVGYWATPWLQVGVDPEYIYADTDFGNESVFGLGVFARAFAIDPVYFTAGYKYNWIRSTTDGPLDITYNHEVSSLLLGAGYRQHLAGNTFLFVEGSFDVLYDKENSLYSSAFIPSVGVSIGL